MSALSLFSIWAVATLAWCVSGVLLHGWRFDLLGAYRFSGGLAVMAIAVWNAQP